MKSVHISSRHFLGYASCLMLLVMTWCACKPAMKNENNIEAWLEKNFPQQFVVEQSLRDLQPKNFFLNKHTAVISSKADPEAQFEIVWYKDKEDLGLSKDEISKLAENSKREVALAREWYAKLKTNGLDKFSAGVIDQALYVIPYGEPDPAFRLHVAEVVFNTLKQTENPAQTSIWIECLEDSAYQKEIKEIIPFGYWRRINTWHEDQKLASLDFEYSPGQDVKELNKHWQFNPGSLRSFKYIKEAYPLALDWANHHINPPFYLEPDQYVEYELDDKNLFNVHYSFPYYSTKPDSSKENTIVEPLGYVTGVFDTEKKTFGSIKKREEN